MDNSRTIHSYLNNFAPNPENDVSDNFTDDDNLQPRYDEESGHQKPRNVWCYSAPLGLVLCSKPSELVGFYHPAFLPQVCPYPHIY